MTNYTGERRIPGTDLRIRLNCTPSGTYGQVIRDVQETWGREGDTFNPPRQVTATKVLATTERFPAYHTNDAWPATCKLAAKVAGHSHATLCRWNEVLCIANSSFKQGQLFYQAPLDTTPRRVTVLKAYKNGKLRIQAGECAFTVDDGHLDRFRVAL
jgi:hypothetical protein